MEEGDPEVVGRGGVASSSFRTAFSPARGSPGRFVALLGRAGEASRRAGSIPLPGSFGVAWGGPVFRHGRAPLVGRCPRTPTCTCACGLSAAPGGRARAFSLLPFSSPPPPFSHRSMRPLGSRRRGPPAGRRSALPVPGKPRRRPVFRHGRPPLQFASRRSRGEALARLGRGRRRRRLRGAWPRRADSSVRPPCRCPRARPTESSCVTAERPREPQAYPFRCERGVGAALVSGPGECRPRAASRRGGNRGKPRGTEAKRAAAEEEGTRRQRGAAPGRAGEPGAARRVPLRIRRGVGAGGVRRPLLRLRAAAARVGFPAASPPAAERAAPGKGLRSWGRARLEVAFSSSTSVSGGGASFPRPLLRRSRRAGQPRPAVRRERESGSRGGGPERAAESSCAAVPAPSPRGGGRRGRPGDRARLSVVVGERASERGNDGGPPAPPRGVRPGGRRRRPGKGQTGKPSEQAREREREGARAVGGGPGPSGRAPWRGYLVDPASSICLSQRLSHACLSTHGRYSETANGSLNQLWFLWSLPSRYLDNCGNSRANTCRRAPTSGDACIYQTKTNPGSPGGFGDSR